MLCQRTTNKKGLTDGRDMDIFPEKGESNRLNYSGEFNMEISSA